MLGSQTVTGRTDRDVIEVGPYQGRFDQITLVVLDSDLELFRLAVIFGNGERWSPQLRHFFREGSRSHQIDLPGDDRMIRRVELAYGNLPGGGRARVEIYGRGSGRLPPPGAVARRPVAFDSTGWTLLGSQVVSGRSDRDVVQVGRYQGRFDQIAMVVQDSDLELSDLTVVFGNDERWSPRLRHFFREGSRSHSIDLPGDDRMIQRIELEYGNLSGGGRARVEIYGRASGRRPHVATAPAPFDPRGWTLLGSEKVGRGRDHDEIRVGRYSGRIDQLMMLVHDSDLELLELKVDFRNGASWSPQLRHFFREGSRTRAIDLPGNDRVIKRIELDYANVRGGGRARVEIYGRDSGRSQTARIVPVRWDNQGWTFLGKTTVDGWRDQDRLRIASRQSFSKLMFVVSGSDVEISDAVVTFSDGEKYATTWQNRFREGSRTAPVDLPGRVREIQSIDFRYGNLPGGGRASVEVWALSSAPRGRLKPER